MRTISAPGGDISLNTSGDLSIASGKEAIRQAIVQRLRFWHGEWFLNRNDGIPYRENIFRNRRPTRLIRTLITAEVVKVPGVRKVSGFELRTVGDSRRYSVGLTVETDVGTVVAESRL